MLLLLNLGCWRTEASEREDIESWMLMDCSVCVGIYLWTAAHYSSFDSLSRLIGFNWIHSNTVHSPLTTTTTTLFVWSSPTILAVGKCKLAKIDRCWEREREWEREWEIRVSFPHPPATGPLCTVRKMRPLRCDRTPGHPLSGVCSEVDGNRLEIFPTFLLFICIINI